MQVSLEYAKEHAASENATRPAPERPRSELLGCLKGELWLAEDWDSPETNAEIADLFEGSDELPDTSTMNAR